MAWRHGDGLLGSLGEAQHQLFFVDALGQVLVDVSEDIEVVFENQVLHDRGSALVHQIGLLQVYHHWQIPVLRGIATRKLVRDHLALLASGVGGCDWPHESLEPLMGVWPVWHAKRVPEVLVRHHWRTAGTSRESAQIVGRSVETGRGDGALPFSSRSGRVVARTGGAKVASQNLVDEAPFESLHISIREIKAVGTHHTSILTDNFLNDLLLQLL